MNEEQFQEWLENILNEHQDDIEEYEKIDDSEQIRNISDFGSLLTNNKGLIVKMNNGSEFELTIVQSEEGDGDGEEED